MKVSLYSLSEVIQDLVLRFQLTRSKCVYELE